MLRNKEDFQFLDDISAYTKFESSLRGGLTSVIHGKVTLNNPYLSNYDPRTPILTAIFRSIYILFPTTMTGHLPVGGFKEYTPEEVRLFEC